MKLVLCQEYIKQIHEFKQVAFCFLVKIEYDYMYNRMRKSGGQFLWNDQGFLLL